jgi:integrase
LAESTGQRISSILGLQRRDVDFDRPPYGWLHFRAEHQKNGRSHWVPVTPECREQLIAHLKCVPPTPDAWLFPSKHDASRPVDVFRMSRLLRSAYKRAGLETLEGGLWHPWRRKWATERKDMPLKDVAEAGGWRDPNTLLKCYQQPDEATMTRVVLEPGKLREA